MLDPLSVCLIAGVASIPVIAISLTALHDKLTNKSTTTSLTPSSIRSALSPKQKTNTALYTLPLPIKGSWYDIQAYAYDFLMHVTHRPRYSENIDGVDLYNALKAANIWLDRKYVYCGSYTYVIDDVQKFNKDVTEVIKRISIERDFIFDEDIIGKKSDVFTSITDQSLNFSPNESWTDLRLRYHRYRKFIKNPKKLNDLAYLINTLNENYEQDWDKSNNIPYLNVSGDPVWDQDLQNKAKDRANRIAEDIDISANEEVYKKYL